MKEIGEGDIVRFDGLDHEVSRIWNDQAEIHRVGDGVRRGGVGLAMLTLVRSARPLDPERFPFSTE